MNNGRFDIGFDIDLEAVTHSEPKMDPGDRYDGQFKGDAHSRAKVNEVHFRRNRQISDLKDCDTPHLLYLLQIACDLHRKWVIERNQYFVSISRTDRFIDHMDGPQLITYLLKWYIEDKQQNVFDGEMMMKNDGHSIIHDMLVEVGMSVDF